MSYPVGNSQPIFAPAAAAPTTHDVAKKDLLYAIQEGQKHANNVRHIKNARIETDPVLIMRAGCMAPGDNFNCLNPVKFVVYYTNDNQQECYTELGQIVPGISKGQGYSYPKEFADMVRELTDLIDLAFAKK